MSKITVFNFVSVDGFFAGPKGEIDWFKLIEKDEEWGNHVHNAAGSRSTLIFGRITYEMMKNYWPSPEALKSDPGMANAVDLSPKIVFSKNLKEVHEEQNWKKIRLLNGINPEEINKLKRQQAMTILGSGSIVRQFSNLDLIDEYFLVVVPVILGSGKSFFTNVKKTNLDLLESRSFKNGIVLLHYGTKNLADREKQLSESMKASV